MVRRDINTKVRHKRSSVATGYLEDVDSASMLSFATCRTVDISMLIRPIALTHHPFISHIYNSLDELYIVIGINNKYKQL